MTQAMSWFERKFTFDFPVEMYPNVCVRLRGTPARLEELLGGFTREQLIVNLPGKWSAQENAGHLLDLEPLWLARVEGFAAGAAELAPADLKNTKTTQANHNARTAREILEEFRADRTKLLERVNRLDPVLFGRTALHPRLKTPMRLVDHLYFVAEHDDHHLARIWELGL